MSESESELDELELDELLESEESLGSELELESDDEDDVSLSSRLFLTSFRARLM